jgi:hypothetical protein
MTEKDISSEEYSPADGVITSLSQLTNEQFLELISCDHLEAKKYRRYAKKEFQYRNMSYQALNDFFNRDKNVSI